jgi:hypothetical protein
VAGLAALAWLLPVNSGINVAWPTYLLQASGQRSANQSASQRREFMSSNVISLRGEFTPPTSEPNSTVVEELERLLEAARAGEILGLAGAYVHRDKVVSYSYAGAVASYGMLGGLDCVKERLLRIATAQD